MIFLHLLEVGYESQPIDYHFGKCRVQVNPQNPNFGHFWSTPGTPNSPKSIPDLMGHYQGSSSVHPSSAGLNHQNTFLLRNNCRLFTLFTYIKQPCHLTTNCPLECATVEILILHNLIMHNSNNALDRGSES